MTARKRPARTVEQQASERRLEAAELERRADRITRDIAVLDMERQRLYARAANLRGTAEDGGVG